MEGNQRIARTDKGPIEYRLEGTGAPIMVLNGGHCSRRTRLSHERLARSGFLVLTPSRPGYDGTPAEIGRSAQDAADCLDALMETLGIPRLDVIGISAAGPTALAFAQRYPNKIRRLVLESAVSLPWDERTKRGSRLVFGSAERMTWAAMRAFVHIAPKAAVRTMLLGLTTLDAASVVRGMGAADLAYVVRMIETSRSGRGFLNDIEHQVSDVSGIGCPTLAMYTRHDKTVRPENALRLAREMSECEVYDTLADCHLIWIGKGADAVWNRRLEFLTA
jgi:pimeloyl-ACP methyl ester carboxylesterase